MSQEPRTLRQLKATAQEASALALKWDDKTFYGGSSTAAFGEEGFVSVMVDPPKDTPHIQFLDKHMRPVAGETTVKVEVLDDDDPIVSVEPAAALEVVTDDGIEVDELGAEFSGTPTFDQVEDRIRAYAIAYEAIPWIIGDMLNYAEARWGEQFAQLTAVAEIMDKGIETVRQWKWVSARIPRDKRREGVAWSLWRHLAYMDDKHALDEAPTYYLEDHTVAQTKAHIREQAQVRSGENTPPPTALGRQTVIEDLPPCPVCGGTLSARTCKDCGTDFGDLAWYLNDLLGEVKALLEEKPVAQVLQDHANYKRLRSIASALEGDENDD